MKLEVNCSNRKRDNFTLFIGNDDIKVSALAQLVRGSCLEELIQNLEDVPYFMCNCVVLDDENTGISVKVYLEENEILNNEIVVGKYLKPMYFWYKDNLFNLLREEPKVDLVNGFSNIKIMK